MSDQARTQFDLLTKLATTAVSLSSAGLGLSLTILRLLGEPLVAPLTLKLTWLCFALSIVAGVYYLFRLANLAIAGAAVFPSDIALAGIVMLGGFVMAISLFSWFALTTF